MRQISQPVYIWLTLVLLAGLSPRIVLAQEAQKNGRIELWSLETGQPKKEQTLKLNHNPYLLSLAFSSDGTLLASWSAWAPAVELRKLDLQTRQVQRIVKLDGTALCVAFTADGKILATGNGPMREQGAEGIGELNLWDAETGQLKRTLLRYDTRVTSLAFSPDGKTLASTDSGRLKLWDVATGKLQRGGRDPIHFGGIAFAPDGKTLAGIGNSGVFLWDLDLADLLWTRKGVSASPQCICFSPPHGKLLATANYSRHGAYHASAVQLWETQTGKLLRTTAVNAPRGDIAVTSVAFSPDGQTLLIAGHGVGLHKPGHRGSRIAFWDVAKWELKQTLSIEGGVGAVVFTPDGKTLAISAAP